MDCNYADICFTVALGSILAGCYTQIYIIPTRYEHSCYARTSRLFVHSLLVCYL